MLDPLAGQYLPLLLTAPGPCDQCGMDAPVYLVVAVAANNPRQIMPCAQCLQQIRLRQWLPETRRLLAMSAGRQTMLQIIMPGQEPDAPPPLPPSEQAVRLVQELCDMVENDPNKGTEHETAFFRDTRPRTREIGAELYALGGHPLMVLAYDMVRLKYGPSARSLEVNWSGVGEWFD
jgi:hypothetical protein